MEAHALKKRGWSISAIARHLGRDRKTVRSYLNGRAGARGAPGRRLIRWPRSRVTSGPGSATTTTCGRRPCSMRSSCWVMRELPDVRAAGPAAAAAAALRGVLGSEGPGHDRDQPPGR